MVLPYYTLAVSIGGRTVFRRALSRSGFSKYGLNHKHLVNVVDYMKMALIRIGIPAKSITTSKIRVGAALPRYTQTINIKPSVSAARSVYKTLAKEKTAIVASLGTSYATALAIAKKDTKKTTKKGRKPTKHVLTTKQKASLKKNGYVYITRNKKQIRITR